MLMPDSEPPKHLQRPEVEAALVRLVQDSAQMARAKKLAKYLASGLRYMDYEDLLSTAMALLIAGVRKWPRKMHTLGMLKGAMRSIADSARKKPNFILLDEDLANYAADDEADIGIESSPLGRAGSSESDPALLAEAESSLREAVAGDEDVELLIEGLATGLHGAEIEKELGWDAKTHEAARKRLSRRLSALTRTGVSHD